MKRKIDTSWGPVSEWYSDYLESGDSYQSAVILPNLLRLLGKKPLRILDIACGQGYFARAFAAQGHTVVGTDIAKELILEAKKLSPTIEYHVAPADQLDFVKNKSFDVATIVLAIQNIENMNGTFAEAARALVHGGRLYLVIMHPAFRNPRMTSWGFDEVTKTQYRRVDRYLSASRAELLVHPGDPKSPTTVSNHRSLQDFSKALARSGFSITKIEEWISHKESQKGPRQAAENTARREIPLFMMLEASLI